MAIRLCLWLSNIHSHLASIHFYFILFYSIAILFVFHTLLILLSLYRDIKVFNVIKIIKLLTLQFLQTPPLYLVSLPCPRHKVMYGEHS
jgi:hypothetical protein